MGESSGGRGVCAYLLVGIRRMRWWRRRSVSSEGKDEEVGELVSQGQKQKERRGQRSRSGRQPPSPLCSSVSLSSNPPPLKKIKQEQNEGRGVCVLTLCGGGGENGGKESLHEEFLLKVIRFE